MELYYSVQLILGSVELSKCSGLSVLLWAYNERCVRVAYERQR